MAHASHGQGRTLYALTKTDIVIGNGDLKKKSFFTMKKAYNDISIETPLAAQVGMNALKEAQDGCRVHATN